MARTDILFGTITRAVSKLCNGCMQYDNVHGCKAPQEHKFGNIHVTYSGVYCHSFINKVGNHVLWTEVIHE